MQKFLSMAEVKAMINPNEDIFTKEELISIQATMQFMQKKFYNDEADKSSDTYKQLITIRNKCIDALEK